jgi:hypothetical protein
MFKQAIISSTPPAPYFIGDVVFALVWSAFLLLTPIESVNLLFGFAILVYLLYQSYRKFGFVPHVCTRVVVLCTVVAVGFFYPARWLFLRQVVGPFPQQATLREVDRALKPYKFRFYVDDDYLDTRVTLPTTPVRLGTLLESIHDESGLEYGVTRFCGTYRSLFLWDGVDTVIIMRPKSVKRPA